MSSNQVASTNTQNIVPVQAEFNTDGNCLGLVGPGGVYFLPPLTGDIVNPITLQIGGNMSLRCNLFLLLLQDLEQAQPLQQFIQWVLKLLLELVVQLVEQFLFLLRLMAGFVMQLM